MTAIKMPAKVGATMLQPAEHAAIDRTAVSTTLGGCGPDDSPALLPEREQDTEDHQADAGDGGERGGASGPADCGP